MNDSSELLAAVGGTIPAPVDELPPGLIGTVTGQAHPKLTKAFTSSGVARDDGPDDKANVRKLLVNLRAVDAALQCLRASGAFEVMLKRYR